MRYKKVGMLALASIMTFIGMGSSSSVSAQGPALKVESFAGSGNFGEEGGEALSSSFRSPKSILVLEDGELLISDSKNHLIRLIEDGQVSNYAGNTLIQDEAGLPAGTWFDGGIEEAVFNQPNGLALDHEGNIYIADTQNHSIRRISPSGEVTTMAGKGVMGNRDGQGEEAQLNAPSDVAVALDGTVYVADTLNHAIRKITKDGYVTTLNTPSDRLVEVTPGQTSSAGDFQDGSLSKAKFNEPTGLAIDPKGNLYVADTGNQRIRYIDFEKNTVTTVAGSNSLAYGEKELYVEGGYKDGAAKQAQFHFPKGMVMTKEGGLLIADSLNHTVRYLFEGQVTTLAGSAGVHGDIDGGNEKALLHMPSDVAVSKDGKTIWVADTYNNKIRKISYLPTVEWYGVGGGYYVAKSSSIKYETPSKSKLAEVKSGKKVNWGKTQLKSGQIGRITVLSSTPLYKLSKDGKEFIVQTRTLNAGEEFRVYNFR
ncbi:copper amine oxidase [Cytobacillus sp. FJAT-54145]|uniref:Copper amine oxidase n=1 Tax=Cytobacillus spartinae TaxID=3299023 RepID=A0ABW6KC08_9BACI